MQNKVKSTSLSSPLFVSFRRDADDAENVAVKIKTILYFYMFTVFCQGRVINRLMCFLHFHITHFAV